MVRTCGEVRRLLLEPPDGGQHGDGRRQAGVADHHGRGEDGEQEERDAHGLARLQELLHPLRAVRRRRGQLQRGQGAPPAEGLGVVLLQDVQLVLRLLVRHQAHLGVPRDERVERERTACMHTIPIPCMSCNNFLCAFGIYHAC